MKEAIAAIDPNDPEYKSKVDAIKEYYSKLMNSNLEELDELLDRSGELNHEFGTQITEDFKETIIGKLYPELEKVSGLTSKTTGLMNDMITTIKTAYDGYSGSITGMLSAAGQNVDGLKSTFETAIGKTENEGIRGLLKGLASDAQTAAKDFNDPENEEGNSFAQAVKAAEKAATDADTAFGNLGEEITSLLGVTDPFNISGMVNQFSGAKGLTSAIDGSITKIEALQSKIKELEGAIANSDYDPNHIAYGNGLTEDEIIRIVENTNVDWNLGLDKTKIENAKNQIRSASAEEATAMLQSIGAGERISEEHKNKFFANTTSYHGNSSGSTTTETSGLNYVTDGDNFKINNDGTLSLYENGTEIGRYTYTEKDGKYYLDDNDLIAKQQLLYNQGYRFIPSGNIKSMTYGKEQIQYYLNDGKRYKIIDIQKANGATYYKVDDKPLEQFVPNGYFVPNEFKIGSIDYETEKDGYIYNGAYPPPITAYRKEDLTKRGSIYYQKAGTQSYTKAFDTGGYTGEWGPEGRLAMLHQKEIVLNAQDTENLLTSVQIMRSVVDKLGLNNALTRLKEVFSGVSRLNTVQASEGTLEQNVTIKAEFPNATDHTQIEEAFGNIINLAAQYANRK